jgi:hypothetical protein
MIEERDTTQKCAVGISMQKPNRTKSKIERPRKSWSLSPDDILIEVEEVVGQKPRIRRWIPTAWVHELEIESLESNRHEKIK